MSDQASSTDTSGSTDLKAGHAPAIKVGGMRVGAPRPRHTSQGEDKEKDTTGNAESGQETSGDSAKEGASGEKTDEGADDEQATAAVANRAAGEMVSGTFVPIQKAFPTEAVKQIHDKPGTHPKHEAHAHPKYDEQRYINQPRKQ